MSVQKPVRVELSKQELFEAAFFLGYAVAKLQSDGVGALHARAEALLRVFIEAEIEPEDEPTITVEGIGVEGSSTVERK